MATERPVPPRPRPAQAPVRGRRPRPTSAAELIDDVFAELSSTPPAAVVRRTRTAADRPPRTSARPTALVVRPASALVTRPATTLARRTAPAAALATLAPARPPRRRARGLAAICLLVSLAAVAALPVIGRAALDPSGSAALVTVLPHAAPTSSLTMADAGALADPTVVPDASAVAPIVESSETLVAGGLRRPGTMTGSTEGWLPATHRSLAQGRSFNSSEVADGAKVAVLGSSAAQSLFPSGGAVGQTIQIRSTALRVIGVLQAPAGGGSPDDRALLPITTVQGIIGASGRTVDRILVAAPSTDAVFAAYQEVDSLLLQTHHSANPFAADFSVTIGAGTGSGLSALGWALGVLAVVSLLLAALAMRGHTPGPLARVVHRRRGSPATAGAPA